MTEQDSQNRLDNLLIPAGRPVDDVVLLEARKVFLEDVIATVHDGLLVLTENLTVLYANQSFYRMFGVTPDETLTRRIYELGNGQWNIPALRRLLEDILPRAGAFADYEVEHTFQGIGRRIMRLNARRVQEIELILLAIEDVTDRVLLARELAAAKLYAEKIINTVREGLLVLAPDLTVQLANDSFYHLFQVKPAETIGRLVYDLGNGQWNIPALRRLLEQVLPDNDAFNDYEVVHEFEQIGLCIMRLNARRVDSIQLILLAIEDVTRRTQALAELKLRQQQLRELNETLETQVAARTEQVRALSSQLAVAEREERQRISQLLHDDLQQRLYSLRVRLALTRHFVQEGRRNEALRETAEIEKLLKESITTTRQLSVDLSPPILYDEGLTQALGWLASQMDERYGMRVEVLAQDSFLIGDSGLLTLLFQIVRELLFNVAKHARGATVVVTLERTDGRLRLRVVDNGPGFDMALLDGATKGLGLARIRNELLLLQGEMTIESAIDAGTQVTIHAPLVMPPPEADDQERAA